MSATTFKKKMTEATGREILTELVKQLGFDDILDEVLATTDVTTAMMPYASALFACRKPGDRPKVVPDRSRKLRLPRPVHGAAGGHRLHGRVLDSRGDARHLPAARRQAADSTDLPRDSRPEDRPERDEDPAAQGRRIRFGRMPGAAIAYPLFV